MKLFLIALLLPGLAFARPVTIEYSPLDPVGCEGESVTYTGIEIYVDTVPIPAADMGCVNTGAVLDVAPVGVTPIAGTATGGTTAIFELPPGTYFIRMWAFSTDGRSQFSNQITRTVPEGNPQAPFVIDLTF